MYVQITEQIPPGSKYNEALPSEVTGFQEGLLYILDGRAHRSKDALLRRLGHKKDTTEICLTSEYVY